jgi:hypothetical protein
MLQDDIFYFILRIEDRRIKLKTKKSKLFYLTKITAAHRGMPWCPGGLVQPCLLSAMRREKSKIKVNK